MDRPQPLDQPDLPFSFPLPSSSPDLFDPWSAYLSASPAASPSFPAAPSSPTSRRAAARAAQAAAQAQADAAVAALRARSSSSASLSATPSATLSATPSPLAHTQAHTQTLTPTQHASQARAAASHHPSPSTSPLPPAVDIKKRARAEARKKGNNTHTRRCRQKVNDRFVELMAVLPPPADGESVAVKHKAEMLSYGIGRIRELSARNVYLEGMLALSSREALVRWVEGAVGGGGGLVGCLERFMGMLCATGRWKYAELWEPGAANGSANGSLRFRASTIASGLEEVVVGRMERYREQSRGFTFAPQTGVPGRVFLTKRPEWLQWLTDPVAFPRAYHAQEHGVKLTFAVPVIIRGEVRMVVEFYDSDAREYDADVLSVASNVANLIGRVFAAKFEDGGGSAAGEGKKIDTLGGCFSMSAAAATAKAALEDDVRVQVEEVREESVGAGRTESACGGSESGEADAADDDEDKL